MHLLIELQLVSYTPIGYILFLLIFLRFTELFFVLKLNQSGGAKHLIGAEGCTYSSDVYLREGVLACFSFQAARDVAGCKTPT